MQKHRIFVSRDRFRTHLNDNPLEVGARVMKWMTAGDLNLTCQKCAQYIGSSLFLLAHTLKKKSSLCCTATSKNLTVDCTV